MRKPFPTHEPGPGPITAAGRKLGALLQGFMDSYSRLKAKSGVVSILEPSPNPDQCTKVYYSELVDLAEWWACSQTQADRMFGGSHE